MYNVASQDVSAKQIAEAIQKGLGLPGPPRSISEQESAEVRDCVRACRRFALQVGLLATTRASSTVMRVSALSCSLSASPTALGQSIVCADQWARAGISVGAWRAGRLHKGTPGCSHRGSC